MDNSEIFRTLEEAFAATFIKELIPGILHNFANPLNGIMERTKLLQRRIEENVKKMEEIYPDAAAGMMEEMKRIRTDIRSISQESESFLDIFKDVAAKFYALAAKGEDNINISQLMYSEMRFVDFNLDFKHDIKNIHICFPYLILQIYSTLNFLSYCIIRIVDYFCKCFNQGVATQSVVNSVG